MMGPLQDPNCLAYSPTIPAANPALPSGSVSPVRCIKSAPRVKNPKANTAETTKPKLNSRNVSRSVGR